MNVLEIKNNKGLDIPIKGIAAKRQVDLMESLQEVAIVPADFFGSLLKPVVKPGEHVSAGQVVMFDKKNEHVKFVAPVSGVVKEIRRGAKRKILAYVVERKGDERKHFEIKHSNNADEIKHLLIEAGLWVTLRQRPFGLVANPADTPDAVYITAADTAPLAPDYAFMLESEKEHFAKGIEVLSELAPVKIIAPKDQKDFFASFEAEELVLVSGKHPVGNLSYVLQKLNPINKTNKVWYINPWHVVFIGRLFHRGYVDLTKSIALTGPGVTTPEYFKVISGVSVATVTQGRIDESKEMRLISGNVLTGFNAGADGFLGFYDDMITVLPEGRYFEFMGWAKPGLKKYSPSGMFFSKLLHSKRKRYVFDTNMHGGVRPFVIPGVSEKYVILDIYPAHLLKAILVNDIDLMEQLGIYEVMPEDFALMEYACVSKINIQDIVKKGIETIIKES